jgi:hypothetical protein
MYEVSADTTLTLFSAFLEGSPASTLLVISTAPLPAAAREALAKSAIALNFGNAPVSFATLKSELGELGPGDLMTLIEGMDPLALIAADTTAAEKLSAAYHSPVQVETLNHLLGRPTLIFQDLAALMESAQGKQAAWALLKKLK